LNSEQTCGFQNVIDEDYGSLKYDAVVNGNLSLVFWRSLMLPSAEQYKKITEVEGSKILSQRRSVSQKT